jgi:histidinol-phosphate phosphatase family protein
MLPLDTVFLDRDGVINVDSPHYVRHRDEFHFIPGSREAIARLTRAAIRVVIITNQSALHRGIMPLAELEAIHARLRAAVAQDGGCITDIRYCPHRPDKGCNCRKPQPGLILAAARRHAIDLSRSVMIGDSAKDILAGKAAGCGGTILVETGNGPSAARSLNARGTPPDHIAADLEQAVAWLLDTPA